MIEVVYYVASSIDGFIAAPDGGVEWLKPFEDGTEDYGYTEFYTSVEAIFMGSRTFEQLGSLGDWPYPGKTGWVFSGRNLESPWPEAVMTNRDPVTVITELETAGIRRAWLVGGGKLAASFRAEGLIGEYIISIIPAILGAGIPLFGAPGPQESLKLAASKAYPNGVVQNRYTAAV